MVQLILGLKKQNGCTFENASKRKYIGPFQTEQDMVYYNKLSAEYKNRLND